MLTPRAEAVAAAQIPANDYLMYVGNQDETISNCDYSVVDAINRDVTLPLHDNKEESEYSGVAMRDLPDRSATGWERQSRQSSGSEVSGVSLACLQGRIQQMEETHHSTNEELQATLQELSDLQVQLNEFQAENDKLKEEKLDLKRKLDLRTEQFKQARDQARNFGFMFECQR